MVEVLKNTSALVKNNSAPGFVYRNFNIKVMNSWLENNSGKIKMVKWNGSGWVELETVEIARDGIYTYYEAKTDSFSPFAITSFKAEAMPIKVVTPSLPERTPIQTPAHLQKNEAWGLKEVLTATAIFLVIIIAIIAAVYMKEQKRK